MKVAFIVGVFPSISTTFILNQITGLLDRGCDVKIFSPRSSKKEKVHLDVSKYHIMDRVYYFDVPKNKIKRVFKAVYLLLANFHRAPIKILRALNVFQYGNLPDTLAFTPIYALIPFLKEKFDIIHCQFGTYGNLGAMLKRIGIRGKLITSFRGRDLRLGLRRGGSIYSQLFKLGDCLMPNSHYAYKTLMSFGASPEKMVFHPSGIDIKKFSYRGSSKQTKTLTRIVVLTVARLVDLKGLQYGIQAVSKLKKRKPKFKLEYRIIGGGSLKKNLTKLIRDLGLSDVVSLLGPMKQEEVIRNLKQAHIFLLPSIAENLGVATMEAQAIGLPVIATSVGALSETIIDGKSGFLVPPKNAEAIAEKLEYLIKHQEIWTMMGQTGRKHVEENYNIDKLNEQLLAIYLKLLKPKPKDEDLNKQPCLPIIG